MKLEILMSAMHQENFDIAYRSKVDSDLLIINQCDKDDYTEIEVNGHIWRMISTTERGLSKSRNMALKNAKGDICLLADDDELFEEGYEQTIIQAYKNIPQASSVVFNLHRINFKMKKTYYQISSIRVAPSYRGYSSQMVTFKREIIQKHIFCFNEHFGSGTQWGGGEEILFQRDIRKAGLKIYEHPQYIATIDYGNGSNWFTGYDEKYFYNLGAFVGFSHSNFFYRKLRELYTCYRLRRENKLSVYQKMRWMHLGEKGFKKNVTYKQYVEQFRKD